MSTVGLGSCVLQLSSHIRLHPIVQRLTRNTEALRCCSDGLSALNKPSSLLLELKRMLLPYRIFHANLLHNRSYTI